jgi:hypothetical protein
MDGPVRTYTLSDFKDAKRGNGSPEPLFSASACCCAWAGKGKETNKSNVKRRSIMDVYSVLA